jgi:adenosylcobinamide kinase/adenosylcobinamide-phosphate guanylyltransferase
MAEPLSIAFSEFILGGQRSGKSRRAEALARDWLSHSPSHDAVLIATAQASDAEMHERIAQHQRDRAERVPGLMTVEEPLRLAEALRAHSTPDTLVLVDCLTLWLTNWLMPMGDAAAMESGQDAAELMEKSHAALSLQAQYAMLLGAIHDAPGPVVLVGNEIGLGVIPMGRETRIFVDELGRLNQDVAKSCERVTLMVAGLPLSLKGQP